MCNIQRERESWKRIYVACVCLVLCRLPKRKIYSDMAHITLIKERSYRSRIANKNANGRENSCGMRLSKRLTFLNALMLIECMLMVENYV